MPDDTHIDLQQTVAALRQELAATRAERDAGLAREAALAEVVQTTNSSPGDLTPVPTLFLQRCTPFAASSMARWSPMTANIFAWPPIAGCPNFGSNSFGSLIAPPPLFRAAEYGRPGRH